MDTAVLEDIKAYAINRLTVAYGYCGAANWKDGVQLNSSDADDADILITITVKKEPS
jgi:uncharacterized protein with FMN-binding domain